MTLQRMPDQTNLNQDSKHMHRGLRAAGESAVSVETSPLATTAVRAISAIEPRARILYVDSEPQLRRLSAHVLIRSGYVVDTVADGAQGWEALQHAHYNLLITEDALPRLSGLQLASHARLAGMRVPILITSESDSPVRDPAWTWLDIAAFLPKPFTLDALVETVEQVLHSVNEEGSVFARISSSIQPWPHGGINE